MRYRLRLNKCVPIFYAHWIHSSATLPTAGQQQLLEGIQIRLLTPEELPRCQQLLDVNHGDIPVSAVLTNASTHDSQVAIPLMPMTAGRVTSLYHFDGCSLRRAGLGPCAGSSSR